MSKTARIIDIAVLNKETYKKNELPEKVKYLDTGNLTKNKISSFQIFNTTHVKLPSRAQRKIRKNTIIYSNVRPNQEHFGIFENDFVNNIVVSTGFTTIDIIDKNISPKYLYYLLTQNNITEYLQSIGENSVSSYPSISPNDIGNLVFNFPDIQTQQSIAKVLSDLDYKIELNNKINKELESMAKTLYDYWFVQFDFPNEEGKPYKSSGGKMVYNAELKREIPEGWEVKKLSEIVETGSGGTPLSTKKEYYKNGNIPWINSGEVNEPYIVSTNNFITQKGLDNSSAKLFQKGTILMAMYGATAGKVSLIDIEASTNQAICSINPKKPFYKLFLLHGLQDLYQYLINLSSGSARDNLSQNKIKELQFLVPNNKLLSDFNKLTQPSVNRIFINLKVNLKLVSLRDWLLPMLMNGQVTVKEVEHH